MLSLACVICVDIFEPSDDVYVTKCGHLFHYHCLCQWLERSKTCPQCRNKCTDENIHRVYFNLANMDGRIIIRNLQEQLDNANLKIKAREKDLRKAEEQIGSMRQSQNKCTETIAALEQKVRQNAFVILTYAEQLKLVREQAQEAQDLRKEVKRLKEQIAMMKNASLILSSATEDAGKLLKKENNPEALAFWVSTLKRELRTSETKKTELSNVLKVVQNDLRKQAEVRSKRDYRITQLESDNHILAEKVENLESEKEKLNSRMSNRRCDTKRLSISPVFYFSIEPSCLFVNSVLAIQALQAKKVKEIRDSIAPYLNIKSSGVPIDLLNATRFKRDNGDNRGLSRFNSDLADKFSIIKHPSLMVLPNGVSSLRKPGGMEYDGFGGSEPVVDDVENTKRTPFEKTSGQSPKCRLNFVNCPPSTPKPSTTIDRSKRQTS